jgi:cysteine desulfurase
MIYLDNAATTPLRPEVRQEMEPYAGELFGNPSGIHRAARQARRAVDEARQGLAEAVGCEPGEVVFTSGGTEADNLAVTGSVLSALAEGSEHPLACCSAIEHPAVLQPVRFLGGIEAPVRGDGLVDLEALEAILAVEGEDLAVVSVMLVNNETGVVQPLSEVAEVVRSLAPRALLHTDAVQALRWIEVEEEAAPADLVSFSAHKVGGPKGTGALVVRQSASRRLAPVIRGGPQEHELRAGTENVAGIVGFAKAATLARAERKDSLEKVSTLAGELLAGIYEAYPAACLAGAGARRVPGICNVGFPGLQAEELLLCLDREGVAVSGGSACASGALEESPVLLAMGLDSAEARSHIRFSFSPLTSSSEVAGALAALERVLVSLRA